MARYKVTKEQLERIVENFVMEASIESKKAPVKNMIPSQGAEAKKHVKNKMSGNMVDHSEGMPSVTPMKKKLSQAADAKKHMSKAGMKHTNKAGVMKEEEVLKEGKSPEELKKEAEELLKAKSSRTGKSTGQMMLDTIVKIYKDKKEESFGDWAKSYFESGDINKALMDILKYQKEKYIEAYVKQGGGSTGSFDYKKGEYAPKDSKTKLSFGGGLF
jgi:hypothetical protein